MAARLDRPHYNVRLKTPRGVTLFDDTQNDLQSLLSRVNSTKRDSECTLRITRYAAGIGSIEYVQSFNLPVNANF